MNNNYKIQANQLTVNAKIYVEGITTYSRLAKRIEGEELEKDKKRKQQRGMVIIDKPYTTISIEDAKIRPQNPAALSLEEQYVQERFYMKSKIDAATNTPVGNTYVYNINNKSPFLPPVSQFDPTTKVAQQVNSNGKELATGLKVLLCLSVYQSKTWGGKGISLDGVIVMEPIRYYTSSAQDYSALGITYVGLPEEEAKEAAMPEHQETAQAQTSAPTAPVGNAFASAQQAQPEHQETAQAQTSAPTAPVGNAFASAQQAQPAAPIANGPTPVGGTVQMQTPVTPTAPANNFANSMNAPVPPTTDPETPWICPSCQTTNPASMKFCGNCGSPKAAVNNGNPYANNAGTAAAATPGIVYEPNPTDRNY